MNMTLQLLKTTCFSDSYNTLVIVIKTYNTIVIVNTHTVPSRELRTYEMYDQTKKLMQNLCINFGTDRLSS